MTNSYQPLPTVILEAVVARRVQPLRTIPRITAMWWRVAVTSRTLEAPLLLPLDFPRMQDVRLAPAVWCRQTRLQVGRHR